MPGGGCGHGSQHTRALRNLRARALRLCEARNQEESEAGVVAGSIRSGPVIERLARP